MNKIQLKKLHKLWDEKEYIMFSEMPEDVNGFMNQANGLTKQEYLNWVENMIQASQGINLKPGYVKQIIYIIYCDKTPIGYIKLRPILNEKLRNHGGSIGIGILKQYQSKGYGSIALSEAIKILEKEYQVKEILETIQENNIASRKIAEKNGLELETIKDGICYYQKRKVAVKKVLKKMRFER